MSAEDGPIRDSAVAQTVAITFRFLILGMVVVVIAWLVSGFRQVQPGHRMLVVRFGRVDRVVDAGLVLAWPFDQVVDVPSPARQLSLTVDRLMRPDDQEPDRRHSQILTGDIGIANLQGVLTYTVTRPEAYYLNQERLAPALERLFCQAAIAATCHRGIDQVMAVRAQGDQQDGHADGDLAAAHEEMREEIRSTLNRHCDELGLGVEVSRLDLVAQLPPDARAAFVAVSTAESASATDIANAQTDAEQKRQAAQAQADRIIADAKAAAEELIADAHERTDDISALLSTTTLDERLLLMTRTYRDRINSILQKGKVSAVDPHQSVRLALPGE